MTGPALLAAACAATAALLVAPATSGLRHSIPLRPAPGRLLRHRPGAPGVAIVVAAVPLLAVVADAAGLALATILAGAVLGAVRLAEVAARGRAAERRAGRVVEACETLAGELRAGLPPPRALDRVAAEWSAFAGVAAAARLDSDVPAAIRAVAARPGAEALRHLAGAWEVSQRTGAGLAFATEQVAEGVRAGRATQRLVLSELSSARATARLVAGLPVFALVLGSSVGDPWSFLLRTPAGLFCLATGLALTLLGLLWIERIAASVVIS